MGQGSMVILIFGTEEGCSRKLLGDVVKFSLRGYGA